MCIRDRMSLPRFTTSIMNLQARHPVMNDARNPAMSGPAAIPAVRSPLVAWSRVSPRIGASTIRNENCATAAFLLPSSRPVAMVEPDRERDVYKRQSQQRPLIPFG